MKKQYKYLLYWLALLYSSLSFAQSVSVNNFTGAAGMTIPLFNVTSGSLSAPVSVSYMGGGLKVKDVEGSAGMSWNINAGGGIYRTVRGLPDDVKKDTLGHDRLGWLYNTNINRINIFDIKNTGAPDCSKEGQDALYISVYFNDINDYEPDVYNAGAPGLSCQFYFDATGNIKFMPDRDYKISYAHNSTTGLITSFTITNDQGVTYVFADTDTDKKTFYTDDTTSVSYFKKDYHQYNGGIRYATAWRLTSMTDVNGNSLLYSYYPVNTYRVTPFKLSPGGGILAVKQFDVIEEISSQVLDHISTSNNSGIPTQVLTFYHNGYARTGTVISSIAGYGQTKSFYYVDANKRGDGRYGREFLHKIDLGDQQLTFTYKGLSTDIANPRISLPDSSSVKIDLWGYYNGMDNLTLLPRVWANPSNTSIERYRNIYGGASHASFTDSIAGADRLAVADSAKIGSLDSIKYSRGGYTTISYESNDYYDPTAASVIQGGGIRVHEIKDFDGINSSSVNSRTYSYTDPSTSQSSGKPISLPTYEYTTPYYGVGPSWDYSTVRSEDDLSAEDETIIYGKVTVSMPETGSTLYEYTTPATFWNASLPTDWAPTKTYVARPSCTTLTHATSDINTYPFPNNPNYDFERGLITKTTSFNNSGTKVSESTYTYQRSNTPTVITGFKFDMNLDVLAYAKYNIYVNTGELTSEVTTKTYDLGSTTAYKQNTVDYYYASAYHKLLTKEQTTNSDGTTAIVNYKYVKDYVPTGTLDSAANAIYHLQLKNCNYPVETWQQVHRDITDLTVGASLTKFKEFDFAGTSFVDYLPSQQLRFISGDGTGSFTPSSITSGVFTSDAGYIVTGNNRQYNYLGYLQTADDNNKNTGTVLTDPNTNQTVATFSNAAFNEVAFMNFDNFIPGAGFDGTFSYVPNGRTGFGVRADVSDFHMKTFSRNPNVNNYIFSVWINSASAGSLTITLNSGSTWHYYELFYTGTGKYTYYQMAIPVSDMGSTFDMYFFEDGAAIYADDFAIYPETAQITTVAYNSITRQKEAETNTNGKAAYFDYDQFNRPLTVYDNDKNIVQRQSYITRNGADPSDMGTATLAASTLGSDAAFTVTLPGITNTDGLSLSWDFGDGTTTSGAATSVAHTYATTGTFTVTVTVNSPYYPSKTLTTSVSPSSVTPTHFINIYGSAPNDGTADLIQADFYQSGVLKYTFNQSQLSSGTYTIPAGFYDVKVYVIGQPYNAGIGTGYSSVSASSNTTTDCNNMVVSKGAVAYNFFADLTGSTLTYYGFSVDNTICP